MGAAEKKHQQEQTNRSKTKVAGVGILRHLWFFENVDLSPHEFKAASH